MKTILVIGGGISGLTVAHELLNKGMTVIIIEKDIFPGGMAKSRREPGNIPSEHSWRGYAPFYKNTFDIMKSIPFNNGKTVYDNLSKPIEFYLLNDKIIKYKSLPTLFDQLYIGYLVLKYATSDHRKEEFYKTNLEKYLKSSLTDDGYDYFINFATGPGFGMEKYNASLGHFLHVPALSYINKHYYTHTHDHSNHIYEHHSTGRWHVLNGPTNEAWINPWVKHLKNLGLRLYLETELIKLTVNTNHITAIIKEKNKIIEIKVDDCVLATSPFDATNIFNNSGMINLYQNHKKLIENSLSQQISFRIGFNKPIKFPIDNIAFVMTDSQFNITWYPQEKHWDVRYMKNISNIKSLWSGTIIDSRTKGLIYNKSAIHLNKTELVNEIIEQILRSKSFKHLIYENNNYILKKNDITYTEIWYEWKYDSKLKTNFQDNKKWVNNIYNESYRPSHITEYPNLYLSGSHTKTTLNIWSMEGAVESGRIVANHILKKYGLPLVTVYSHNHPWYIQIIQIIDNIFYKLHLPNITNVILILILFFIFSYFIRSE